MRKNHKSNVSMNCTVVVCFISILSFSTLRVCVSRSLKSILYGFIWGTMATVKIVKPIFPFITHIPNEWPSFEKGKSRKIKHEHTVNSFVKHGTFTRFVYRR